MAISEELELDISGALDAIESLNDSLTGLGESLTVTLTGAIEAVDVTPLVEQLAALDASGLTTTIDAAIDATDGVVPIDADTSAVPGEIDASIDAANGTVPIDADTAAIPGEIDASIAEADSTVLVDADTSGFGGSIDEALAAADAVVAVDADASGISDAVDAELATLDATVDVDASVNAEGFDEIDAAADQSTEKISGIGPAAEIAGGLATGSFEGAAGGIASLTGPVGGIAAGFAAVLGVLINKGTDLKGVLQRAHDVAGPFLDDIRNINVGTLNTEIGKLAGKLGASEAGLTDAATSAFQFAKQSGFTGKAAAEFSNNVIALSARAVALNPKLGSVEEVAARLQKQFLSGRGLTQFVGQLDDAEVQAKAFALTGKTLPEELTKTDLALARAAVGAEKFGGSIEKDINKGSKNAIIQQRALNGQIQDFLAQVGKPLVAPFLKLMKETLPIVKTLAPVFADLGKEAIPALAESLKNSVPLIKAFGDFMKLLSPIIGPLQAIINATINPVGELIGLLGGIGDLPDIAGFFSGIGNAISGFLGNVVGFGADLIDSFLVGIQQAFPAVISFFAKLGTTIFSTIGDVLTSITQKGTDIITGLFTGITTAVVAVFNFFRNLPSTIFNTIGNVVGTLTQKGVDLLQGMVVGLGQKVQEVFAFVRRIPGRIVGAIGNVSRSLFRAGVDIISGLINGIISRAGDIVRVLKKRVTDVIPGFIKSALGIGSPSKVLAKIGEDIGGGLIQGLDSSLVGIKKSSAAMVAAALPIPGVGRLPAVAAALPVSAGSAAAVAAGTTSITGSTVAQGNGGIVINVHTTNPDPVAVGLETVRQLRAESFRSQR